MQKIEFMFQKIPAELKERHAWVNWKYEVRGGKETKPPIQISGHYASSTKPNTWTDFESAEKNYNDHKGNDVAGVGFTFSADDPFVGIDLDHCRNPETGIVEPWARETIDLLRTYSEVSPSSTGVKIFGKGAVPKGLKKSGLGPNGEGKIEIYSSSRYFTITGWHLTGTPSTVEDCNDRLTQLCSKLFKDGLTTADEKEPETLEDPAVPTIEERSYLSDTEVIEKAGKAANSEKFRRLFIDGNQEGYRSTSEADSALCMILAFWCGNDAAQIDRLFRQSKLMRDKWDEKHKGDGSTYGQMTIEKATSKNQQIYIPETGNWIVDSYLTDLGNSYRFARQGKDKLFYCGAAGGWHLWDETRWKRDDSHQVMNFAKQVALSIFDEAKRATNDESRKEIAKHAIKSQARDRLSAMADLARCELPTSSKGLDANPWLLNVLNGTIDLKTGKLLPHRREDRITKITPVEFNPDAECPLWNTFLEQVTQNDDTVMAYLQQIAGICLTGNIREQVLFIIYGPGSNGKNVFMDTLVGVMGDYASEAPPDLLMIKKRDEHPTELADLYGKRLVTAYEVEENSRLKVQLIKRLTGNRTIKARFMRQDFFEFDRTHKMILGTNSRPKIRETTHAVWRRIRLIPFEVVIPDEEQDRDLLDKLRNEWPGILKWAVQGCLSWQKNGLITPEAVRGATEQYEREEDPLTEFIEERCELNPEAFVSRTDIFGEYQEWATEAKERNPLERQGFYNRLRRHGFKDDEWKIQGKKVRGFVGIYVAKGNFETTDEKSGSWVAGGRK